jgi:hypothetical protein
MKLAIDAMFECLRVRHGWQGIISKHAPATLNELTAKYDEVTGIES